MSNSRQRTEEREYRPVVASDIWAEEIVSIREAAGLRVGKVGLWAACVEESLAVSGLRDFKTQELVGVGFLAGNARNALICDVAVRPEHRTWPVGRTIIERLLVDADRLEIESVAYRHDMHSGVVKTDLGEILDLQHARSFYLPQQ